MDLSILEKSIGYEFKNKDLLKKALTHTSYANEHHVESNEKLEFLGDSIFEAVIAAIYFDSDLEHAEKFIVDNLKDEIQIASEHVGMKDYKTVLQEKLQVHGDVDIKYEILEYRLHQGPRDNHDLAQPGPGELGPYLPRLCDH